MSLTEFEEIGLNPSKFHKIYSHKIYAHPSKEF